MRKCLFIGLVLFLFSCTAQKNSQGRPITGLRFLGDYTLPHKMQFRGTTIGGLSSIDYVPSEDSYYLICDDRSEFNPARFYTTKIFLSGKGIDSVSFLQVTTLRQQNGQPFPNRKQDSLHVPDPEGLRYHEKTQRFVWTSEGERIIRGKTVILSNPAINIMDRNGKKIDTFPLPANLHMTATERGPRQNGALEGLTFSADNRWLFTSMEEPLFEDGPRAGLRDTTGWIRIFKYDVESKKPVAQYAYQLDPVVQEPISAGLFVVNGVPDILVVNSHQLLVTERSFSTGRLTCNVRVYLAEINGAGDITGMPSLFQQPPLRPLQKKLLLNMDALGRWVDNVEGATFGPRLSNGKRSLLFVTDDNFAAFEKTQFFLFEVQD